MRENVWHLSWGGFKQEIMNGIMSEIHQIMHSVEQVAFQSTYSSQNKL